MINGKTQTGFEFSMDERVLEDWSFLQAIADADSGEDSRVIKGITELAGMIAGKDGMKKLIQHVKEHNEGYAPVTEVEKEIIDIINQSKEIKKSTSSPG